MDTWATSSLTPHIAGGWETDPDLFERVFPMDLCTHAHDIIRTWLFSRVVRANFENGTLPWRDVLISGFVLAGTGKGKQDKLSKSAATPRSTPSTCCRRTAPTRSAGARRSLGPAWTRRSTSRR